MVRPRYVYVAKHPLGGYLYYAVMPFEVEGERIIISGRRNFARFVSGVESFGEGCEIRNRDHKDFPRWYDNEGGYIPLDEREMNELKAHTTIPSVRDLTKMFCLPSKGKK